MTTRATLLFCATLLSACTRDESSPEERSPIQAKTLRTPASAVRVADAHKRVATPIAPAAAIPDIIEEAGRPGRPVAAATATVAMVATVAEVATPPATAIPPVQPTVAQAVAISRPGFVPRGTDLFASPDGSPLGQFEGRTAITVLEESGGWSRVRAPVIDGGDVEGWVKSIAVTAPNETRPSGAKPPVAVAQVKDASEAKGPAKAASAPAKAAPAKAAPVKAHGNKGPNEILLIPIAGTAKKRPATPFTHKAHYDDYSIQCESCHHPVKAQGGKVPSYSCAASGCHTANECNGATVDKKNKACPNFEDAYHMQCIDCHKKDGGPTKCAECHTG